MTFVLYVEIIRLRYLQYGYCFILIKTTSAVPLADAAKPMVSVHRDAPRMDEPCHIVLSCRSVRPELTEIAWLKDGRPFESSAVTPANGTLPPVVQLASRLVFQHPGAAEDGVYACTASSRSPVAVGSPPASVVSGHNFTLTASKRAPAECVAVREAHAKRLAARAKRGGRAALEHAVLHEVQARENEPAWLACEVGGGKKKQQQQQHGVVGHSVKWLKDGKLLRHTELLGAHETAQTTETTFSENGRPREDCK